jgi:hypothetical protein
MVEEYLKKGFSALSQVAKMWNLPVESAEEPMT